MNGDGLKMNDDTRYRDWGRSYWASIVLELRGEPWRTSILISKENAPDPVRMGMRTSVGLPVGQSADYRLQLADGAGLHVQDCGDYWSVHLDEVDPSSSLLGHLRKDAPRVLAGGIVLIGATLGAVVFGFIFRGRP